MEQAYSLWKGMNFTTEIAFNLDTLGGVAAEIRDQKGKRTLEERTCRQQHFALLSPG